MTKHTERLPKLPGGSIDFNKVHEAAKKGVEDPFKGAVSHTRSAPKKDKTPAPVADAADATKGKVAE